METKPNQTPLSQKQRMEQLILQFNLTFRELAEMAGLNENTIYHINSGRNALSERTAAKICYQFEKQRGIVINRDWLLSGEGEMIDETLSLPLAEPARQVPTPAATDYREKYFQLLEQYTDLCNKYTDVCNKYTAILERLAQ